MDLSAESVLSGLDQFLLMEKQWHYRGEGNSKIAISLPAEKKVVLLLKSSKNETPGDIETWRCMKDNIAFVSSVMRSLLGQAFVSCSTLIYLCSDDIETLNKKLAGVRPENRLHKVLFFRGAEYCNDYTFLPKEMSELCQSKSVCVEIKPKQGIFPSSDIKNRNCLFCCKQQLKLKDGLTTQRSKYCPLDLFSGCRLRIKRALKSLLDSPQNNLRIFCDGNLVFGEGNSIKDLKEFLSQWLHPVTDSDIVERFTSMILQALMKDMRCLPALSQDLPKEWIYDGLPEFFPSKKTSVASVQFQNNNLPPCDFGRRDSPEGSILHALALAQSLDQWGLSEVLDKVPIYYNHPNQSQENITTGYVFDVIEKGCTSKLNPIELYLIAAVVRDCSAFITFQEMQQNFNRTCSLPKVEETYSKTCYLLKISVADINPKRFSVIYSHASRNYKILEAIKSQ